MANETAKQKAIIEAYGEHWQTVKQDVDENGWLYHPRGGEVIFDPWIGAMHEHPTDDAYRPKSLSGIENNNGWISIESVDDLPKEEGQYFVYSKVDWHPYFRIDVFSGRLSNSIHHVTGKPIFSHYQPIEKPKPPIY